MKTNAMAEAWIDVGGTFTDCYVRRVDGRVQRLKTLSSGRVPITPTQWHSAYELEAAELCGDASEFWNGAELRLCSAADGEVLGRCRVVRFDNGRMLLDRPWEHEIRQGVNAELDLGVEAPVLAVRRLLGIGLGGQLPRLHVRLGTTKGTNALLTRSGARTAVALTAPFTDLLTIGDQTRPDLFALGIRKVAPLAEVNLGIVERLSAKGEVLVPLDVEQARSVLAGARQQGCESLAICLMHAYLNPQHEQQLIKLAEEIGFEHISCSHQLAPLIEWVARAQTTVVDAYLSPIVRSYLRLLVEQFGGVSAVDLLALTSAGGLVRWSDYSGKDSILSGPAGGVAALGAMAEIGTHLPCPALIGLDMGGTSTDVCRVAGTPNLQYESTKAGVRILTPTLPIETVASGGGSICWFDGVSLRVGPQSAGAAPGPACYGRGGPLTITDVNVYLGRIPPQQFPFAIERKAIERRLDELIVVSKVALGIHDRAELAAGFRALANEQMAEAVRSVSIARGADPRQHTLVGFGGAAGQHICEIAELLDIDHVWDSPEAGLLSGLGMGLAACRADAVVAVYETLDSVDWHALNHRTHEVVEQLKQQLREQSGRHEQAANLQVTRLLELRYAKTDTTLIVAWDPPSGKVADLRAEFHRAHRGRYGYQRTEHDVELVAVRLEAHTVGDPNLLTSVHASCAASQASLDLPTSGAEPTSWPDGSAIDENQQLRCYRREALLGEQVIHGPCIVLNSGSTLVIEAGWSAKLQSDATLLLSRNARASLTKTELEPPATLEQSADLDPVFRDCFAQRMSAIAVQMGIVLQQTAVSVNVKQRRDFSCAVFDAHGQLLSSAPHVPVHLGAMGKTVRAVLEQFPELRPGDSFITNDPYRGGSHLPDVTVITPTFASPEDQQPVFFVANRAHHADIGGLAPGSMSIEATRLGHEGVIIPLLRLTSATEDFFSELEQLLRNAEFPPRNIAENLADIDAQLAANNRGIELLNDYARSTNWELLRAYAAHLLDAAEQRVRQFLAATYRGSYEFADHLDDGTPLRVQLDFSSTGAVKIDFNGTGPTSRVNFNANPSIVTAAVMYVLRCLIADSLPLNEGVMRCVELTIPEGLLNPPATGDPAWRPAVAAGNVETSQRVVDVLLGALGAAAASQGTMNNLLFGNQFFGFYETICGGAGAVAGVPGASGVHTHMTNTRLTDPEVLEFRYPVRLRDFGLRCGSGGAGKWPGGEGVRRVLEFLQPVQLSLLTSRRGPYPPFGMQGGQPGATGENVLHRANGHREVLPGCCEVRISAGDRLEIETPGGGGYGR